MFWSLIGRKCIMWLRIIPLESLYYVIFSPRPNSKIPKPKIRADKPTATAAHCCTCTCRLQLHGPERPPQYTTCMHTALRCIHCAIERLQQQWLIPRREIKIHQFLRQGLMPLFLTKICFHWLNRRWHRQFKERGKILIAFSRVVSYFLICYANQ